MTGNAYTNNIPKSHFTQTMHMVPLAPAPSLAYVPPQLNAPMAQQEAALADAPEGDLTSDLHFPVRLHYMLTDIHKEGVHTNIVSWAPHGR